MRSMGGNIFVCWLSCQISVRQKYKSDCLTKVSVCKNFQKNKRESSIYTITWFWVSFSYLSTAIAVSVKVDIYTDVP